MDKDDLMAQCKSMMQEAMQHIDAENPKEALKIGKELEKLRFSGAFEIQALAYAAMDKKNRAIKILGSVYIYFNHCMIAA